MASNFYSLIGENMERYKLGIVWSDLSKPGMRRLTDFLDGSNLTGSITLLLLLLAGAERRSCASSLGLLDMISFQLGREPIGTCGHKAKGKGEKFLTISSYSTSEYGEAVPNAPETCAPAWIVQPQYHNAEITDVGLFGSTTR